MRKLSVSVILCLLCLLVFGTTGSAYSTQVVDLGDTTIETVNIGYSGDYRRESLAYWFDQHGITNLDGTAINPVDDQQQYELFYTDVATSYQVEFLGIGYAAFHSPFGVFSYSGDPYETFNPDNVTYYDPLFVQNEVDVNSTFTFGLEADTYFGFYLDSNGSGNNLTTMIATNSDGLDHALFFETNRGYTISFEDIVGGGDRDYEDLVVNISLADNSEFSPEPVPEPATLGLLGLGILGVFGIGRSRLRRK